MKKIAFFIALLFFTSLSFAQNRALKLVKAPVENPTNQKRKAVVIGMSDYGKSLKLDNTLRDADDMADVLTRLGFEVTLLKDNDLRNLKTNLNNWYNTIEGNDMAVFYFAGHGMEVQGENYLIPVDAELSSEADVPYTTLNVNQVLKNMELRRVGMKLLILDACRNNPLTRGWNRSGEVKGLAQMSAPDGTFIAFAAAAGKEAADGGTYKLQNGVFTHYLKQEILKAGVSIDAIFTNVSREVSNLTNKQQTPFRNSSLTEIFYFIPPGNNEQPVPVTPVQSKYYYYIDQNGNESKEHFTSRELASKAMKEKNLYGKIYSNGGEVFVVDRPAPAEPEKPVVVVQRNENFTDPSINLEMVYVAGDSYMMGCTSEQGSDCWDFEKPAHQVSVSSFYIGKYEVTQAQWKAVMGNNPSEFKGDNLPVEKVSWDDVQEFIQRLNRMQSQYTYRLPSEEEWEYAARGGNNSNNYKYSGSNNADYVAWYGDNSGDTTHPVGTKSPNELGIYDMSGNVWEWCSNCWRSDYNTSANCSYRVYRGGSWFNVAWIVRVSNRYYNTPAYRYDFLGFRLACSSK